MVTQQKVQKVVLMILACLLISSCGATRTEVVRGARVPEIKLPEKVELLDPEKKAEPGTLYVTPPKILKPEQNYRAGKDGNAVLEPKDWRLLRDALSSYWSWISITSRNVSDHNKIFDDKKKSESGVREFLKDWTWKF